MNVDVVQFEQNLIAFKGTISQNYRLTQERFAEAIAEIDKTIDHLQKVKSNLVSSERHMRLLNDKTEDLNIQKLTKNAPAVQQMFADANIT